MGDSYFTKHHLFATWQAQSYSDVCDNMVNRPHRILRPVDVKWFDMRCSALCLVYLVRASDLRASGTCFISTNCKWKVVCSLEGHSGLNARACERYVRDSANPQVCECKIVHDECENNWIYSITLSSAVSLVSSQMKGELEERIDNDLHKYYTNESTS
jgi:hypothetical protein